MVAFIVVSIIFLIGMLLGGYIFFILLIKTYDSDPELVINCLEGKDLDEELKSKTNKSTNKSTNKVELICEYHGSQVYVFFKKDDVFAGQGTTLAEALEQAMQRFPGVLFSVEQ
jgi:hypothetical protein